MKNFLEKPAVWVMSLVVGLVFGLAIPASAGPQPGQCPDGALSTPGKTCVMAQNTEPEKGKPAPAATAPKKARSARPMEAPAPAMEMERSKSGMIGGEPEKAGTEKIGGQVIRSKEGPGGE
jgi:hypothetical protein